MSIQYAKALTAKYAKEKLGKEDEFKGVTEKLDDAQEAFDGLDLKDLTEMNLSNFLDEIKELASRRDKLHEKLVKEKEKLDKKLKPPGGTDKDKKDAAKATAMLTKFNAYCVELEDGCESRQDATFHGGQGTGEADEMERSQAGNAKGL